MSHYCVVERTQIRQVSGSCRKHAPAREVPIKGYLFVEQIARTVITIFRMERQAGYARIRCIRTAPSNTFIIFSTLKSCHDETSPLKEEASANMNDISFAFLMSQ